MKRLILAALLMLAAVNDYDAGARAGAVFGRATAQLIERIER